MDTGMQMAESLCCPPEAITTLSRGYGPMLKKKKITEAKQRKGSTEHAEVLNKTLTTGTRARGWTTRRHNL